MLPRRGRSGEMLTINPSEIQLKSEKDQLFVKGGWPKPFEFNEAVVKVFDDMVSRSVPLYREVNESVLQWSWFYQQKDTAIVDLGCSTGTTLELIARTFDNRMALIGVDTSQPMLDEAKAKLHKFYDKHQIELLHSDLENVLLPKTSVVIMNYTLQFIAVRKRREIIKKIYESLCPGGILYLSEKVRSSSPAFYETTTMIYENFKMRAGYTATEVARKKEALDQVLTPLTICELSQMMLDAGFKHQEIVLKWNNFTSIVAQK